MKPANRTTTALSWSLYEPSTEAPWDRRRVVHLHRRAGFAASPDEVRRDLNDGPSASVGRLLLGRAREGRVPENFEATSRLLADSAVASDDPMRLKAWWIFRMMAGPDPLGERLTLLWHGHFATSNAKVADLSAMRRQNDAFRRLARAPFAALLDESIRQPALLSWLDAPANRKTHPNENLARELMELFTLGIGAYTEQDVKESARALTGWTVKDEAFAEVAAQHDDSEKTILNRKARWTGCDLLKALAAHPSTASRIARKLCGVFLGEGVVDDSGVRALAERLRSDDLDIGKGVEIILRSKAFFAEENLGNRVLGPAEFAVGSAVVLGRLDPTPSTLLMADWIARMGQDLFYPPNVGGWPGGRSWLSARGLIARANYSAALVAGPGVSLTVPLNALELADREGDGDPLVAASRLIFGHDPLPSWRDRIDREVENVKARDPDAARGVITRALASAEAQLG